MQLKIVIVGIFQLILLPVFASIAAVNAYYCDLASWKSKCALGRKENDSSVGFQFESCARLSLQEEVLQGEHANFTTNFKTMIDFNYTATPLVNLVGNILKCMINGTKDVEHNIHFFNMKHLRQFLKNRYCMWNFYKYACCLLFDLKLKSEKPTNRSTYQEEDIENKALTSSFSQEIKENCTDSTPILRNASVSPESSELNVTSADTFMDELYNWSRMSEKEFTRQIFPFIVLNMGTALVSFVGNGILVFLFFRHKELRTKSNIMILNLTVANMFCVVMNTIFSIPSLWCTSWNWLVMAALWDIITGTCVYSMTVISFQRYLAVKNIARYNSIKPKPFGMSTVLIVWILSCVVAIPTLLYYYIGPHTYLKLISIFYFFFHFLIPAIIVSVFTVATSRKLRRSIQEMPGEALGQEVVKRSRTKTIKVLVAICVCFVSSYIPIFIVDIATNVFHLIPAKDYLFAAYVSFSVSFIYISLNPIALYVLSRTFRHYFDTQFLCCFDKIRLNCGCSKLAEPSLLVSDTSSILVV